jgi:outer membrane protein assembly factor BamB
MKLAVILGNWGNTCDRFLSTGYKDHPRKTEMFRKAATPRRRRHEMMRYVGLAILLFTCWQMSVCAEEAAPEKVAAALLGVKRLRPGVCVHLPCGDGRLTALLLDKGRFQVQGLTSDRKQVSAAREYIQSQGLYGAVSVDAHPLKDLPYVDNSVNLLVCEDLPALLKGGMSLRELLRVLAPYGTAFLGAPDQAALELALAGIDRRQVTFPAAPGQWARYVKPYPPEMDEWPQIEYNSAGTATSDDQIVGPPTTVRWIAGGSEERRRLTAVLSAGGRLYHVLDYRSIVARDAFSGVFLWKRNYVTAPWIADGNRFFTTVKGKAVALDAATGDVATTYDMSSLLGYAEGVLFSPSKAIDATTGRTLWERKAAVGFPSLVAGGRIVFLTDARRGNPEMVCVDLRSGVELWRKPSEGKLLKIHQGMIFTYEIVNLPPAMIRGKRRDKQQGRNRAFSLEDGTHLWSAEYVLPGHHGQPHFFFYGKQAWVQTGDIKQTYPQGEAWQSYDVTTGRPGKSIPIGPKLFYRCYPHRATARYILAGCLYFFDPNAGSIKAYHGSRAACGVGNIPANGLLYHFPNKCICLSQVQGIPALAAEPVDARREQLLAGSHSVEKGMVYGSVSTEARGPSGWPTYRGGPSRRGISTETIPGRLTLKWRVKPAVQLSAPVVSGNVLLVTVLRSHQLLALDAATGKEKWRFTTGGPSDTPPTVVGDLVVLGAADGWVYALRLTDGALAWRFRAAPADRRLPVGGGFESSWPVHGSVLVDEGTAYVAAGRHSDLDGGIYVHALDIKTGAPRWRRRILRKGQPVPAALPELTTATNSVMSIHDGVLTMDTWRIDAKSGDMKEVMVGKMLRCNGWNSGALWGGPHGFLEDNSLKAFTSGHGNSDWTWGSIRADALATDGQRAYGFLTNEVRGKGPGRRYRIVSEVFCAKPTSSAKGWSDHMPKDATVWKVALPGGVIPAAVILAGKTVVVGCRTNGDSPGLLLLLSAIDGEERGRVAISSPPAWDGLAVSGGSLFVTGTDGALLCLGRK